MQVDEILQDIAAYCQRTGLAESTFGRRAVNDGKLVQRLREGGRITTDTFDRIRLFMAQKPTGRSSLMPSRRMAAALPAMSGPAAIEALVAPQPYSEPAANPQGNFRFFDNWQKYLLFVHTCSEKRVVASRVALELANIHPRPPSRSR